jgi:predicted ATPase with chaperone activity
MEVLGQPAREADGDDPWWAIAARQSRPAVPEASVPSPVVQEPVEERPVPSEARPPADPAAPFVPQAPRTLEESGLSASEIESLILKFLLNRGVAAGSDVAAQLHLPFAVISPLLRQAKGERLVVYKAAAPMSDYFYELTEAGHERARRYARQCTYFGAAPVVLGQYVAAVRAQSVTLQKPRLGDLRKALKDLVLAPEIFSQLGQAVNAGMGLFLYGAPGNGKTSIAERITAAFGESVWIPRAVSVLGEIIRVYDPTCHDAMPPSGQAADAARIDQRWIRIRRPTIVVGGELTLENLEISNNAATHISEAPLQMKANCGVLVIDDFGRQRIRPEELLNRWIVPLEKRYDFLNLANGRKIQVPFDQLIVFSTNLEPRDLVDEAFLRRIPYKIDVPDPTEEQFRGLFARLAASTGIECPEGMIDYLVATHHRGANRPLRFCHARDLLQQIRIYCEFHEIHSAATRDSIDAAARNYFAML